MKILCLHGMGTSGNILERQLAPLKHALGGDHEWVFVDGPCEWPGHSSVKDRLPGPYYCYHEGLDCFDQKEAHEFLQEVIDDEGPFDGILGFSQGASLATSFLIQHKIDHPKKPLPFRFAVLFNAALVVSADIHYLEDELKTEADTGEKTSRKNLNRDENPDTLLSEYLSTRGKPLKGISKHRLPGKRAQVVEEVIGLFKLAIRAAELEGWAMKETAYSGKTMDNFPRIMHPMIISARIDIPTSIIVGKEDKLYYFSLVQKRLCTKGLRDFVVHSGGHDIPRAGAALNTAVNSFKWAIAKAELIKMGTTV